MSDLEPGVRTKAHWRVGRQHMVMGAERRRKRRVIGLGRCVSVTPWGAGRIRWVRLRFPDGTEKSFAPFELRQVAG